MKKAEAKQAITWLSDGTIATLTGLYKYSDIEKIVLKMLHRIDRESVVDCKTWQDVWNKLYKPSDAEELLKQHSDQSIQGVLKPIFDKYGVVRKVNIDEYICKDGSRLKLYMEPESILISNRGNIVEQYTNGKFEPVTLKWGDKEVYFSLPLVNDVINHMGNTLKPKLQAILDKSIARLIGYKDAIHIATYGMHMMMLTADEEGTMVLRVIHHICRKTLFEVKVTGSGIKKEFHDAMQVLTSWEG